MTKIRSIVDGATDIQVEKPMKFSRDLSQERPFPTSLLPPVLSEAIVELHERIGSHENICAQSVLAGATLAVQGLAKIRLPQGTVRSLGNFFLTVAKTGYRKSSTDGEVLKPFHDFEKELGEIFQEAYAKYQREHDVWTAEKKRILSKAKLDQQERLVQLTKLGQEPKCPVTPYILMKDATIDGLVKFLQKGPYSVGLFSDEGAQFLGGYSLKEENKNRTGAVLSKLWDGDGIDRVRVEEMIRIENRVVSSHLMIQPEVASHIFRDGFLSYQGLLSRMLVAMAQPPLKRTVFSNAEKTSSLHGTLFGLLQREARRFRELPSQDSLREVTFTGEAIEVWDAFNDHLHEMCFEDPDTGELQPIINKMGEHAARLAAVIKLVQNPCAETLDKTDMMIGGELANFYIFQANNVQASFSTTEESQRLDRLAAWIEKRNIDGYIFSSMMLREGPRFLRNQKDLASLMKILEEVGKIEKVRKGMILEGKTRKHVWRVL